MACNVPTIKNIPRRVAQRLIRVSVSDDAHRLEQTTCSGARFSSTPSPTTTTLPANRIKDIAFYCGQTGSKVKQVQDNEAAESLIVSSPRANQRRADFGIWPRPFCRLTPAQDFAARSVLCS
ncbi:hypothetical protein CLCR_02676 [Cladophialophora carrionii]|uniref:Uncharacterized protein n=1 Tax=Cladophialophora carrionii TaxID=86049 RepID=A0A1C1CFL5_9EURO|nr:hypothetical protein CLCR_02676 [Cladophialophora carrionii]